MLFLKKYFTHKKRCFVWKGIDANGQYCYGQIFDTHPMLIKAKLRQAQITPLKVNNAPLFHISRKITPNLMTLFSRQLATLMHAKLPLVQALALIEKNSDHNSFKNMLQKIQTALHSGMSLHEAFAQHPWQSLFKK